ncbi:hypothetical protein GCM10023189_20660 [Nibrella saemangeumensis]|uniref:Lipocalin-like domain-containing protein n=2 Tax=Nibrella saemangeumensis TaxID=1084526 RepID=A0ABP8MU14_9BACT
MLSIPADAPCEFIKWRLALQRDPRPQQQQSPTMYTLDYTYGMTKPITMDFLNGGTSLEKTGKWAVRKEPGNREIYVLNPDTPETTISFIRLDDNLLHLLDREGKLMIGHGGWSYTLNRK